MTTTQQPGESNLERYERLAEEFRKSTGMMAPGKDSPLIDPGEHTWEERSTAWTWWCRGYGCAERRSDQRAGAGEWVAVNERMPSDGDVVIVHGGVAKYTDGDWFSLMTGCARRIQWRVLWWKPLGNTTPPMESPTHERGDGEAGK